MKRCLRTRKSCSWSSATLNEHFAPISRLLHERIRDPELRLIALRRVTRHIWHWQADQERLDGLAVLGHPGSNGGGNGAVATVEEAGPSTTEHDRRAAYEAARAEGREPDAWVTGEEPATPKQLEVLRDRGIPHAEGVTKAEASVLIPAVLAFRGMTA